ncbi:MAG: hypothetical protein VX546_07750 [Myxococcota bacterium]|nr:hypothetical protein [Myxococcota bacterium]
MQQQDGPRTPFEVFCNQCRVTFAAGTKTCVHCGARLSGRRARRRLDFSPFGSDETPPGAPGPDHLETIEEEPTKRSLPVSPMTLLWVIILLGAGLQRACLPG